MIRYSRINNLNQIHMTYIIQDKETGNTIDEFATYEEAEQALVQYEAEDTTDGTYTPDFYEIKLK